MPSSEHCFSKNKSFLFFETIISLLLGIPHQGSDTHICLWETVYQAGCRDTRENLNGHFTITWIHQIWVYVLLPALLRGNHELYPTAQQKNLLLLKHLVRFPDFLGTATCTTPITTMHVPKISLSPSPPVICSMILVCLVRYQRKSLSIIWNISAFAVPTSEKINYSYCRTATHRRISCKRIIDHRQKTEIESCKTIQTGFGQIGLMIH